MDHYPEPDSHIRDKVKVVLGLPIYATKKELEHAAGADTSNLAAKSDIIALKAEDDKLEINVSVNPPTGWNDLKTKIYDLDVGKLKTVPIDLKKLSDMMSKDVVKETVYNKLSTKVNNLEKKIPDTFTLIQINQYNTDTHNLEKKWRC